MTGAALRAREGEAGFTLVEVLVAFAIMAITMVMALRVLADGAAWARRGPLQADRVEEAASLVNTLIADPRSGRGEQAGVFADGSRWRVRRTDVTAFLAPASKTRLLRIELFLDDAAARPLFVTIASEPAS